MVRNYQKKKSNPPPSDTQICEALELKTTSGQSFRKVAEISGIPKSTLQTYSKRFEDCSSLPPDTKIKPTFHHLQVLSPTHEQQLEDYLIEAQLRSHGISPTELKQLAYSFALFNSIPVPPAWVEKEISGKDWFTNFIKRHPKLSIRKPEPTSQARAAALNKVVMNKFYDQVFCVNLILSKAYLYIINCPGASTLREIQFWSRVDLQLR